MANNKLTTCRHCGAQIAVSAKTCPSCGGKNKKPVYRRVWFWLVIAVIVFSLAAGSKGSGSAQPKSKNKLVGQISTETPESSSTNPDTPVLQEIYRVGDILHDGDMDIVYVSSCTYAGYSQYFGPKDGNKIICLTMAVLNTSKKKDTVISSFSFDCYADGYACDAYYGGDGDLSATLSAGRCTMGNIYFEVPKDAQKIEIEYEPDFWTDEKITFSFEGDQNSGYQLPKNITISGDAVAPGEQVDTEDLKIIYLRCFADKSNNQFIKPAEGCRYITCEFEFENISQSDQLVSALEFDCYADGAACSSSYFRDDNLSATISSGRKAKGTVTFEVPKDASIMEVEYETNFLTDKRIVFDASAVK